MSASDKKKLRKEQYVEKMTKRQQQAKAEAKKMKAYTIGFISLMVAIVVVLAVVLTANWYKNSGRAEKKTIAATIGDYKLNTVEMSYYYNDVINKFYAETFGSYYSEEYVQSLNIDLTKDLSKQTNPITGTSWKEYFIQEALNTAKSDFAMYNKAKEAGFQMPEEQQYNLTTDLSSVKLSAQTQGISADTLLRQYYGNGSSLKSYTKYLERKYIAEAYYDFYYNSLTYTDEEIRAYEADKFDNYNSYTYDYVYVSHLDFREGGTTNENGSTEYSDEEINAAREKAKAIAEELCVAKDEEELKALISGKDAATAGKLEVKEAKDAMHLSVVSQNADLATWLNDPSRVEGEIGLIEVTAKVDEEAEESEYVTNGYYIVVFKSRTDNAVGMDNVRHILIQPEGGHLSDDGQSMVYTTAEQTIAKQDAEKILAGWKEAGATEEGFIALVKEHSADTASVENGGLYEEINPHSSYEPNFLAWAINPDRKPGDTEIVETSYGQHIMYYVGKTEQTYRDYLISVDMANEEIEKFYQDAQDATIVTRKDLSKLKVSSAITG